MLRYPQSKSVSLLTHLTPYMVSSGTVRHLGLTSLVCLPFAVFVTLLQPAQAQNLAPASPNLTEDSNQAPDLTDTNELRPLTQDGSLLSIAGGQRLMTEANGAVSAQNYALASKKLQEARQVFNQLSNFYQQLGASFSGIDNRVFEAQRKRAVETAQMRDEATYQLALVHRAQNQPDLAVPLLIQILKSQQPTRDLGKKAYQQLIELGFVDSPSANPPSNQPTSSTSPKS